MDYIILPVTEAARQVVDLPVSPGGHAFQARVELRWMEAAGKWVLSISDAVTGEPYVNQVPVICSYGELNDLLFPFRWHFQGDGIGSLFCLKAVDLPASPDPGRNNLQEFQILWGDRWV